MGKETAKFTAAKQVTYLKHPDSPAAQTAAAKAAEEERKRLEQEAAARTANNTPELIDADPENETTTSSPSASVSGDEGLETTDSLEEEKKEYEATDLAPVAKEEEKPQSAKTPDQQGSSMLRSLLYSGMFICGMVTVFYIYYSTVLKSQDASSSKFTLKGASELLNKLFSKEILR